LCIRGTFTIFLAEEGWDMEVFGIKIDSLAVVFATFAGPILAVLATRYLDDHKAKRQRQRAIFDTLMLTRRAAISPEHVRALNQIELEFASDKQVMVAFHAYFDHLNEPFPDPTQAVLNERFLARRRRLFAEMVKLIGERQNFKIDRMDLIEGGYYPVGWQTDEAFNRENLQLLNAILQGRRPIWVVGGVPPAQGGAPPAAPAPGPNPASPFPPPP
jgi:hypothetical protein